MKYKKIKGRNSLIISLLLISAVAFSQNNQQQQQGIEKLKMDPKLRYGKLDNGLTYYIRHNELPKERAEFYIVQNVGSLQEEETQRGLAHFLEHMAFNGSKNFPAKTGIQDYVESIGMKNGENLNAYTGFEQTVYTLMNAPVATEGVVDSCLLILHDWSSFLLLEDDAIEKERGVIREEWRTRSGAQMRVLEQQLPELMPESKYSVRLPIGDINIINTFPGDVLRNYYKKWYRPDLQAIIIVGDIDVDKVQAKIKKMFADISIPVNPAERKRYGVPDNPSPLVSIAKDKELTNITLEIYYKHETMPDIVKGTIADFLTQYNKAVISQIMSERFADIVQKSNPPFVAAYAGDDYFYISKTKDAWSSGALVKDGNIERAMKALVAETERVKQHGFTEAEYQRARDNILKSYETAYKERDKQQNSVFAQEYIDNFTDGECIPGIEAEYEIIKYIAPNFPLEGVNTFVKELFNETEGGKNIVISLTGPDKADIKYPTKAELLNMFIAASSEKIEIKKEKEISKILIPNLPAPGKIVSEREDPLFGATLFTLSNGVRVAVKKTDNKEDEILMTATSPGGLTLFKDDKDIWNCKVINKAIQIGGLGNFSASDMYKAIAGKNVSLSAGIGDAYEIINGSASPSDLKTLFELIYLQVTSMRQDDDAYKSFEERVKSELENQQLSPWIAFSDTVSATVYNNNPRNERLRAADFDKVNYHRMLEMYNERFADASDFIFTFVGNVNLDALRPFFEQYLATLPSLKRIEKGDENQVTPFVKGKIERHFSRELETPKSTIGLLYSGEMPYNKKNIITSQLLSNILDLVYTEKVRENESASYGVQTSVSMYDFPLGRTSIQIYFDTDPGRTDQIAGIVKTELERIANEGPRENDIKKAVMSILKGRSEIMQENRYWLDIIDTYYYRNFDLHTGYNEILNSITADDIKSFTKAFLDQGNVVEVVMSPTPADEKK